MLTTERSTGEFLKRLLRVCALTHMRERDQSIRKALENRTNMEDDRITLLENQLGQARLIAEESDKKYEEVRERGAGR